MRRVMIVGGPGSGKSTLAREVGRRTGLPVFHMDHIHWQAGWIERAREEKISLARQVEARDEWIFEGGLSETYESRLARADTVIWLDFTVGLRFWRVLKRSVRYFGRSRPDLPPGCKEGFGKETLPFWRFIWRTRHTARARLSALVDAAPTQVRVVHLQNPAEVRAYLRTEL
jgi:adenylate kinase family enzyme